MQEDKHGALSRAVSYVGNRTLVVGEVPTPVAGPGEVTIGVAYTGICGTDLHILHGQMDQRVTVPLVIGHEMSGRVEQVGSGVVGWDVGDAVTVMPLDSCSTCAACRRGLGHICHRLNFVGIDSAGSMRASWTVPAGLLVRLPPELPLAVGALVEPTAVAVHDVRRAGLQAGETVLVVGGGPVGVLIALVAKAVGADVILAEVDQRRREFVTSMGITVVDPAVDVATTIDTWTAGAGVDVAFEVSGSASGVTAAVGALAARGRLVMVAIHAVPRELDLFRIFWRELTVIGARVYEPHDFETAVQLLSTKAVPAEPLITKVVPLDQAAAAFAMLERGEAMKILVECQPS